jgi:hypothetical protein
MRKAEPFERQLGVRLPSDVLRWLEKRAENERRNLSAMVRLLLEDVMKAEAEAKTRAKTKPQK